MNKIKDFIKDKKKLAIILGGAIILIAVILLVIFVLIPNIGNSEEKVETNLENMLKEMGKEFYENYYYDNAGKTDEERTNFLTRFESIGIKVDLDNLGRVNGGANKDKIAEFVNPSTKEACDTKNTKVIIYPKGNYGKKDYTLEVQLDCGFENNEKK